MSPSRTGLLLALLFALVATAEIPSASALTLASSAFSDATAIPSEHGCAVGDLSPPLAWTDPPERAASFALIVEDLDAGKGHGAGWPQWIVYDIPPAKRALEPGVPRSDRLADGTKQGVTGTGKLGWQGPCPPAGESHRYRFQIFALDTLSQLAPGASSADLRSAMRGHVLAEASLVTSYQR